MQRLPKNHFQQSRLHKRTLNTATRPARLPTPSTIRTRHSLIIAKVPAITPDPPGPRESAVSCATCRSIEGAQKTDRCIYTVRCCSSKNTRHANPESNSNATPKSSPPASDELPTRAHATTEEPTKDHETRNTERQTNTASRKRQTPKRTGRDQIQRELERQLKTEQQQSKQHKLCGGHGARS